jgi:hypothetical protein
MNRNRAPRRTVWQNGAGRGRAAVIAWPVSKEQSAWESVVRWLSRTLRPSNGRTGLTLSHRAVRRPDR